MSTHSSTIVLIILFLLFIVLVNYIIFSMLRNKKGSSEFDIMIKSTISIRKPFAEEDKQLDELSRLVNELNLDKETEN